MIRLSTLFLIMILSRKHASGPLMLIPRCQAFASNIKTNTNKRQQVFRNTGTMRLKHIINSNNLWILRGGGDSATFSGSQQQPSFQSATMSLLSSTASSSMSLSVVENKAMESLAIAGGGGKISTSMKPFGGISYRDSSSLHKVNEGGSSLFRVVFVLGGPGAGKGTQCELLIQNYPCVHLSAGQLLRDEAQKKDGSSEHAALIEECLVAGKIVPVEISLSLLQKAMGEFEGNDSLVFLIDGFPRNFDNLEGWTRYMTSINNIKTDGSVATDAAVWGVLSYDCPLSTLEERVMERSKDSGRSDDNLESLRRRFKTFQDETVPVINTLKVIEDKTSSLLRVVDIEGQQSLNKVWEETQKTMNSFIQNDVLSANMRLLKAISTNDVDTYQNLCAEDFFPQVDVNDNNKNKSNNKSIMAIQEEEENDRFAEIKIKCAEMTFVTGKKVSVSYDRTSDSGITFRETRIWSHQGTKGWRMVHFSRAI